MEWKSVCCAVQGKGHSKKNIPCQDKVARLEMNGVQVIALADGAGSASMSHFGAECVVDSVSKFVAENFLDLIAQDDGRIVKQEILSVALQALNDAAKIHDCTLKDLASTLLVAAVGDGKFFLVHLGDGVIGYLNDAGLKTASTPDNGEFSNETVFVTSTNAAAHMRLYKGLLKKISGFILMSDGSEQSLYNKRNKNLAPAVKRLMHRTCLVDAEILTPQLEDAIKSVILDNTQDDCSIAILARNSEQLPPLNELPLSERQELFRIDGSSAFRKVRRKIFRCDKICALLAKPLTLKQLARKLHLKPHYAEKKLRRLTDAGIVTRTANGFKTYGN
ncbi:MAG: protein phosphatase 2C domain-containing protein [Selenomonadaceae bacterium]|nr:protein phosphatase 2C domain-containing protein [Selenomonadaceae bacterium]